MRRWIEAPNAVKPQNDVPGTVIMPPVKDKLSPEALDQGSEDRKRRPPLRKARFQQPQCLLPAEKADEPPVDQGPGRIRPHDRLLEAERVPRNRRLGGDLERP
ncbi:hypothetical protein AB1399_13780, partial [Hydrogenibacillus schlegelii]|uniref:hypothetical protein n=1 Tax=Hydrogenibacillus schlegelii TaxID=1484 RepID=UPI00349FDC00